MHGSLIRFVAVVLLIIGGVEASDGNRKGRTDNDGKVVDRASESPATESADMRVLSKEITVAASLDDVWHSWTTPEGIASFFSSDSKVELRVGGPYECYFGAEPDADGKRGTQGCKVLSFVPREMLSFEWNFPPWIPALRSKDAKTHAVLRFQDSGNGEVKIRFDQLGWGEGEAWDKGYAYFDKAWDQVLLKLKDHLEGRETVIPRENTGQVPKEDD